MINAFKNYLIQGKVKKKTPDFQEADSLVKKAEKRLKYSKEKKIDTDISSFILEDSYDAVRESAQALMSIKGFKPYSHEAIIAFLKDFYGGDFTEEELNRFNRFRQLRNDSIYRAKEVLEEDAELCQKFAEDFVEKIKRIINRKAK